MRYFASTAVVAGAVKKRKTTASEDIDTDGWTDCCCCCFRRSSKRGCKSDGEAGEIDISRVGSRWRGAKEEKKRRVAEVKECAFLIN